MHKIVFSCDRGKAAAAARIIRLGGVGGDPPLTMLEGVEPDTDAVRTF